MSNSDFSLEEAELWNRTCRWLELDKDDDDDAAIHIQCVEPAVPAISKPKEPRSPVVFSPDRWVHDKRQRWIREALCRLDVGKERGSRQGLDSGVSLSFDEAGTGGSKKKPLHKKEERKR